MKNVLFFARWSVRRSQSHTVLLERGFFFAARALE